MSKQRAFDEAIEGLWRVIDEAKGVLESSKYTPMEKRAWATILANTVSVLNKVVQAQKKGEQIDEDDLTKLLEKVPERYTKMVHQALKESTREVK
jgi:hypothetical protein